MSAKDIFIKPISSKEANDFMKRVHYSGKVVNNSQVHLGVFYAGNLEGALQFGPCLVKAHMQGLVRDTKWNGFLELNRMAFTDALPRNSESRAISISMRLLKKHAPHLEWIISFADGTQCGDGTIYRASGFKLTAIKQNSELAQLPDGSVIHALTPRTSPMKPRAELGGKSFYDLTGGKASWKTYLEATGGVTLSGFQLRYIYFLNPEAESRLITPSLPFSKIAEMGATMYKGVSGRSIRSNASDFRSEEGGANPTLLLQPSAPELADKPPQGIGKSKKNFKKS